MLHTQGIEELLRRHLVHLLETGIQVIAAHPELLGKLLDLNLFTEVFHDEVIGFAGLGALQIAQTLKRALCLIVFDQMGGEVEKTAMAMLSSLMSPEKPTHM